MKVTLDQYKVSQNFLVHWGDMDAAKHVNNLVYFRWAESARIHYFAKMAMDTSFQSNETGPILGWQDCKYIFPITFPDTVTVGIRVLEVLPDRFVMEAAIFSKKHQRIVAISKQHIIPYNYSTFKKVALPTAWRQQIESIENGKGED